MTDPWTRIDCYHWRHLTGRYYIERSRAPDGWAFLAWHKRPRATGEKYEPVATCISPERRVSFEAAAADCAAHYKRAKRGMHHEPRATLYAEEGEGAQAKARG